MSKNNYREANVNATKLPQITTITDLEKYAKGTIVKLPDFAENQPFVARLRRPSLLVLAKSGKIPNSLLSSASELFTKGSMSEVGNQDVLNDMYDICKIIAESSLVTPTLEEIENAGLTLTDEQLMAIFNYSQQGVKAVENFR